MILIPLINSCTLSLQLVIKTFSLILALFDISIFKIIIVEIVNLSLILLYQVFHPMKRLNVLFVDILEDGVRKHKIGESITIFNEVILIESERMIYNVNFVSYLMLLQTIIFIINFAHFYILY